MLNFFLPGENHEAKDRMDNLLIFGFEYLAMLSVVSNLLPTRFSGLDFASLYVGFIIFKGIDYINYVGKSTVFIVGTSILMLLTPTIIKYLLEILVYVE